MSRRVASPDSVPGVGSPVIRAVIPAAGLGTRLLPATKSIPKEMLPIVDKPVVQLVIEEAVASGITEVHLVTRREKRAIEDHFSPDPELEASLRKMGREDLVERLHAVTGRCRVSYIRQEQPLGLGHAIQLARPHVGDEPFAVLLGDAIIAPFAHAPPGLRQLMDAHAQTQGSVVAVHRVPEDRVSRYGIVEGEASSPDRPDLLRVRRLVEKPEPGRAPSDLAIAGRYILTPAIFECLAGITPGAAGEMQLTDALDLLARKESLHALTWRARRYDIGDRADYVRCFIEFALRRPETAETVRSLAQRLLGGSGATE